jgi:uncharacterized protein YjbI with pentapeptide repeats
MSQFQNGKGNSRMASQDHIAILRAGVEKWNKWREENNASQADLEKAHLREVNLREVNLVRANLGRANLGGANLRGAFLQGANLGEADLGGADLRAADLRMVNLEGANLCGTNLGGANLGGANLRRANLWKANLREANLWRADLRGVDLDEVKSFYKAKLDTEVLSRIKANWPEKLASMWDVTAKYWILDEALLEQIKKPGWFGWPEEEGPRYLDDEQVEAKQQR